MGLCLDACKTCSERFRFSLVRSQEKFFFFLFILIFVSAASAVFLFALRLESSTQQALDGFFRAELLSSSEENVLEAEPVEILFVGDIMLSRNVGRVMQDLNDFEYPFARTADILRSADLTIGNLESPISSRGSDVGSMYSFRADPRAVMGLKSAGFDAVSLANNHIWDWGADALVDTVTLLSDAGISTAGAGENYTSANSSVVLEASGTSIGFLSYTTLYPEGLSASGERAGVSDIGNVENAVSSLRENVDLVVVSLHWGEEYEALSNSAQQNLARRIADAGADVVVGHHPHVIQEVERHGDSWIIYSLGNFVFDQTFSEATRTGMVLKVTAKEGKIIDVRTMKVYISETFQPAFVDL
jgi:poly-gamma-glutamate capsule biosynthesis protein CapA/YwtB (metallophosphatase superfamily)